MAASMWSRNIAGALKAGRNGQISYFKGVSDLKVSANSAIKTNPVRNLTINGLVDRCLSTSAFLQSPENDKPETGEEDLEKNPFFDKYADKIKKAKQEGISKPVTLEQISQRAKLETQKVKRHMEKMEQKMDERKAAEANTSRIPKKLDDIMKMEQLEGKSGKEIGEIWTEFYRSKHAISAVIPGNVYNRIYSRSVECPIFIYPLAKDQGYQFMLGQFSGNQCFFTSLLDYQVHGENAPWQMSLTHFTELQEEKDIVLMAGEIDQNNLNILEAQCLAQQLQIFYATSDEERFNLVHVFNKQPDKFKYMDVIREVETSRLIENLDVSK